MKKKNIEEIKNNYIEIYSIHFLLFINKYTIIEIFLFCFVSINCTDILVEVMSSEVMIQTTCAHHAAYIHSYIGNTVNRSNKFLLRTFMRYDNYSIAFKH